MALNAADEQQARDYLRQAGVSGTCPACGTADAWIIGDVIAAVLPTPGSAVPILWSVAMVPRVCQHGTHVMLFAAKPMGLTT